MSECVCKTENQREKERERKTYHIHEERSLDESTVDEIAHRTRRRSFCPNFERAPTPLRVLERAPVSEVAPETLLLTVVCSSGLLRSVCPRNTFLSQRNLIIYVNNYPFRNKLYWTHVYFLRSLVFYYNDTKHGLRTFGRFFIQIPRLSPNPSRPRNISFFFLTKVATIVRTGCSFSFLAL